MTTLTTTSLATLPRVNLLPPEIEEQRRFRRVQAGLGGAVAIAVALVAAGFVMANSEVSSARDDLEAAKAEQSTLKAQEAEYAQVPLVYAQVDAAEAQLELAMGKEVRWSYFLNDVALQIPSKVWLTNINVSQTVDGGPAGAPSPTLLPQTNAYALGGLGTVKFQGKAYSHRDVAAWLDMLAKQKGYAQPYFTDSTKDEALEEVASDAEPVTFSSQVTITDDALSGRYTDKAGS